MVRARVGGMCCLKFFVFCFSVVRSTAAQKAGGGVGGIAVGDIIRVLVSRTISTQFGCAVEAATALFQHELSTRAGCECIVHALHAWHEVNPTSTVMFVDGSSALDLESGTVMVGGLSQVAGVSTECSMERRQLATGTTERGRRTTSSGAEGRSKGDPLMLLLFAVGHHNVSQAVQDRLRDG